MQRKWADIDRYCFFSFLLFSPLYLSLFALVKNTQWTHTVHKFAFLTSKSLVLLLGPSIRLCQPERSRLMPETWPCEAVPGQAGFKPILRDFKCCRSQPARGQTNAHCCHNWNHMLSNGAEVRLSWECVDSWKWECILFIHVWASQGSLTLFC